MGHMTGLHKFRLARQPGASLRIWPLARTWFRARGWILGFFLFSGLQPAVPAGQQPVPNQAGRHAQSPFAGFGNADPAMAEKQMRALNLERQKSMVADADKLLKLARELNAEIGAGAGDSLTPAQLRKVADIEKLARNVKQKMSYSVSGGPQVDEPIPVLIR